MRGRGNHNTYLVYLWGDRGLGWGAQAVPSWWLIPEQWLPHVAHACTLTCQSPASCLQGAAQAQMRKISAVISTGVDRTPANILRAVQAALQIETM